MQDSPLIIPYLALARRTTNRLSHHYPVTFRSFSDAPRCSISLVADESPGFSYPPRTFSTRAPGTINVRFPKVEFFSMPRQYVDICSSYPFDPREGCFWVDPAFIESCNYASNSAGHLRAHGTRVAMLQLRNNPRSIPKGIFLGGNGSFNYYHWLVEIVSKLHALRFIQGEMSHWPLLVSSRVRSIPAFSEIIQLLVPGHSIEYLEENQSYLVENVGCISPFVTAPFNLRPSYSFSAEHFLTSPQAIEFLRQSLANQPEGNSQSWPERIFLGRRANRPYNQEQIHAAAARHGFELIYPENYSFVEQVALFRNAKIIAGPSGAAWSNLVFANPGSKALCWMAAELGEFAAFSNIAGILEIDLRYLLYASGTTNTSEIYRHSYSLDVQEFERALEELLS
jgi:capsular polysaccharide biosynthesis protein